jgi:hypothetical protein
MAVFSGIDAPNAGTRTGDEIVEISLLLPASRVDDLVELARRRGQTVARLLRVLIDDAVHAASS